MFGGFYRVWRKRLLGRFLRLAARGTCRWRRDAHDIEQPGQARQDGYAGSSASITKPVASTARPMPPRMPAGWRSARRPAIGARIAVITAQGVINRPVSTAEAPSTSWK